MAFLYMSAFTSEFQKLYSLKTIFPVYKNGNYSDFLDYYFT